MSIQSKWIPVGNVKTAYEGEIALWGNCLKNELENHGWHVRACAEHGTVQHYWVFDNRFYSIEAMRLPGNRVIKIGDPISDDQVGEREAIRIAIVKWEK